MSGFSSKLFRFIQADAEEEGVYKVVGGSHAAKLARTSNPQLEFVFPLCDLRASLSAPVSQEFLGVRVQFPG